MTPNNCHANKTKGKECCSRLRRDEIRAPLKRLLGRLAVQGPGPNQFACKSPLEVSRRESGSYVGHS